MAPLNALRVSGTIRPPGDKSISHRALILSAVSRGKSRITNVLESADVRATAAALRLLGAAIPPLSDDFFVAGIQPRYLRSPRLPIDCGNSGTTARLISGVIAGAGLTATFTGDASLSRRPMTRIAEPLRAMGARVDVASHGGLPMVIASGPLRPIEWESVVASAQVKSAILLAGVLGGVRAVVSEPFLSRDHTERMLVYRGVTLAREGNRVEVPAGQRLRPADVRVPADPSSAAYFVALATLASAGELRMTDVCLNPTRTGFLTVLRRMGAELDVMDRREDGGEMTGTIVARPSALRAIEIGPDEIPALIDELPLLACIATRAAGETVVLGAGELRVKESDRIATIVRNLRALGAEAEELRDGFRVTGARGALHGAISTHGDHRVAMSFGILGALPGNRIVIDDRDCVAVSYPGFWRDLDSVQA
ncbi:MAG: 3-phosphoshikimate 1-carboxyvinyltransferase [Gemmatimonadaceae bacterium]